MWNELPGKFTSSNWRTWPVELADYLRVSVSTCDMRPGAASAHNSALRDHRDTTSTVPRDAAVQLMHKEALRPEVSHHGVLSRWGIV